MLESKSKGSLVAKNIGAIVVSAGTILLYYNSTKKVRDIMVKIDSMGANFVINWWSGYVSLDYLSQSKNTQVIPIQENCDAAGLFKKLIAAITSILCSIPYGVASYAFAEGSSAWRLFTGGLVILSNVPLYLYSISQFIENEAVRGMNFTSNFVRDVFCSGDKAEKQRVRDLELIRRVVVTQLREAIKAIKAGELDLEAVPELIPSQQTEQLELLANKIPTNQSAFWKNCAGKTLSFIGNAAKTTIKMASAGLVVYSAVGYECATKQQLNQKPFDASDETAWSIATVVMMPLYYLCFRAGWDVADSLCNYAGNLMQGKFVKPTIWKLGGNKFGPLFQILLLVAAGLLTYRSGYTSRILEVDQCPKNIQFDQSAKLIDYGTDVFNGIYVLYGLSDGLQGLMNIFGGNQEKTYLQLLNMAESTLSEIEKMSREKFLNYTQNVLGQTNIETRRKLFNAEGGEISDEPAKVKVTEKTKLTKKTTSVNAALEKNNPSAALERLCAPQMRV